MVPLWPGSHNAILVNLSINIVYDCNDLTRSGQIWWFDQKLHDKHVSGFPDLVIDNTHRNNFSPIFFFCPPDMSVAVSFFLSTVK